MKRLPLVLLALAALACFTTPPATILKASGAEFAEPQRRPVVVYVTRTGKKYHRAGCRHLSQSKIPLSISEAVERGYTPCKVCRPAQ